MNAPIAPERRNISEVLTPSRVALVTDVESSRPDDYRTALSLVGRFSRRYIDSEDVAAIGAVLLGEAMAECEDISKAASLATYRAASAVSALNVAQGQAIERPAGDTLAVAEDYEPHPYLPRATFTAPDACTVWTAQNRLAAMARVMATDVAVCKRILTVLEVWASTRSVSAVQRALGLPTGGRGAVAMRAEIDDTLHRALLVAQSDVFATCLAEIAPMGRVNDGARDWARDSRIATSGPASLVVLTRPDGSRWLVLDTVAHMLTDDAAGVTLGYVDRESAYVGGTARECDSADLMAAWHAGISRPARRASGLGIDRKTGLANARSGNGAGVVTPDTEPDARPTMGSKRKRDGSIGTSMLIGSSRMGNGSGASTADGRRYSGTDALAARVAGMTATQRAGFERAQSAAVAAAHALADRDSAPMVGACELFIGPRPASWL